MNESSARNTASAVLIAIGLIAAIVELFVTPFLFTPIAAIALLIGIGISDKYRRFGLTMAIVVSACFIIGAAAAVWSSRALY